ncbi:helix-turn-helix domain-containing protein [Streptacidiphilus rugosus]|uniref:helix-turn-helix domain-containing protein n=1 Tax=Streptacidiphilus rugosus TaxID=405783 RepID=UPI00056A892F|nr:helix-turn-helix transcriptional regulator [Streptacidiphilus rugosus]
MSPTSPSSNVEEAKKALGQRLRELRLDAGLTARALAALCGWHESKSSRLEHGKMAPSDEDLRAWTRHCGVPEQAAGLIATARAVDSMYVEWQRMERAGLKQAQESVLPLFERTRRFRAYQSWVIPGLLQTSAYTRAVLETIVALRGVQDDVTEAVAVRLDRQRVLHSGNHRFAVLVEEWVLRTVIGNPDIMGAQLGRLIEVALLPSVSLGIIPMGVPRGAGWPVESFTVYDDTQVNVELVSAHLTVTQPAEVGMYVETFAALSHLAVYGGNARRLIGAAIQALG